MTGDTSAAVSPIDYRWSMSAFGRNVNGSTQHPYSTVPLGIRARGSYGAVRGAGTAMASRERAQSSKRRSEPGALVCQAIRVVAGSKLAVFPGPETQRLCEPLATPMIQHDFRGAMAVRRSVASTG